eukprot:6184660-Pleurochrysis_carterae.AAC.1
MHSWRAGVARSLHLAGAVVGSGKLVECARRWPLQLTHAVHLVQAYQQCMQLTQDLDVCERAHTEQIWCNASTYRDERTGRLLGAPALWAKKAAFDAKRSARGATLPLTTSGIINTTACWCMLRGPMAFVHNTAEQITRPSAKQISARPGLFARDVAPDGPRHISLSFSTSDACSCSRAYVAHQLDAQRRASRSTQMAPTSESHNSGSVQTIRKTVNNASESEALHESRAVTEGEAKLEASRDGALLRTVSPAVTDFEAVLHTPDDIAVKSAGDACKCNLVSSSMHFAIRAWELGETCYAGAEGCDESMHTDEMFSQRTPSNPSHGSADLLTVNGVRQMHADAIAAADDERIQDTLDDSLTLTQEDESAQLFSALSSWTGTSFPKSTTESGASTSSFAESSSEALASDSLPSALHVHEIEQHLVLKSEAAEAASVPDVPPDTPSDALLVSDVVPEEDFKADLDGKKAFVSEERDASVQDEGDACMQTEEDACVETRADGPPSFSHAHADWLASTPLETPSVAPIAQATPSSSPKPSPSSSQSSSSPPPPPPPSSSSSSQSKPSSSSSPSSLSPPSPPSLPPPSSSPHTPTTVWLWQIASKRFGAEVA